MKNKSLSSNMYYKMMIALGMLLSILWVTFIDTKPFSDFDYYYTLAVNIANGLPWGDTYTSVGYSIVLGGIFKVFGASIFKAKIFNLLLTLISYISFMSILFKIDIKERDRKIIFALFVLMPNNIFYNSILATEILFTTIILLTTSIYFGNTKYKYIWIGILTGLNTMIKPFFIAFFFAIFLVDLLKEKDIKLATKNSLIILILSIVVISPWIYRNTKLVGQYTYVSNNGGIVLYINNNSQNKAGRWMAAEDVENSIVKTADYQMANMTEKNKMLGNAAKEWIKTHPKEFMQLGIKRLFNTYFWGDDVLYSTHDSNLSDYSNAFLFTTTNNIRTLIFGAGIIYILVYSIIILINMFKRTTESLNKFTLYTVVIFYMFTGVYFITEGQGRYSFPEIFIMVYSFYFFIKFLVFKFKELLS